MDRTGKGDLYLKVLSLLVAVVLWVYVSNEMNPVKEQEFKDMGVDIRGVASNLAVSELPGSVSVRVQGSQDVISNLNPRSLEVFVDLRNTRAGRNSVPVQVRVPPEVKVVELRPQQVTLKTEPLSEKQVPIKVRAGDSAAKGYKTAAIQTKPDEVIIKGPKSVVDKVNLAAVDINLRNKHRTFSETLPVRVVDDLGAFVEERLVKPVPSVVDVFVSIVPDLPSKQVKVLPVIIGEPKQGYAVTMTVIDPPELVITGTLDTIGKMTEVSTRPIDVKGAEKDVYVEVSPELPYGVVANRQSLRVLVTIGKE